MKSLWGSFEGKKLFIVAWILWKHQSPVKWSLQQTICGEIERPNKDQEFPEIAKKVPKTSNNDKEIDENQSKERNNWNWTN